MFSCEDSSIKVGRLKSNSKIQVDKMRKCDSMIVVV